MVLTTNKFVCLSCTSPNVNLSILLLCHFLVPCSCFKFDQQYHLPSTERGKEGKQRIAITKLKT